MKVISIDLTYLNILHSYSYPNILTYVYGYVYVLIHIFLITYFLMLSLDFDEVQYNLTITKAHTCFHTFDKVF